MRFSTILDLLTAVINVLMILSAYKAWFGDGWERVGVFMITFLAVVPLGFVLALRWGVIVERRRWLRVNTVVAALSTSIICLRLAFLPK